MKDYQKRILELLLKQEDLLSKLYKSFADKFPELKDFWTQLSQSEIQHVNWIKKLYALEKQKEILFHEDKIKTYTVKAFVDYIEKTIKKTEDNDNLTVLNALSYTIDLESALLEKNIFAHFIGLTEKMEGILNLLSEDTKNHVKKAKKMKEEWERRAAP